MAGLMHRSSLWICKLQPLSTEHCTFTWVQQSSCSPLLVRFDPSSVSSSNSISPSIVMSTLTLMTLSPPTLRLDLFWISIVCIGNDTSWLATKLMFWRLLVIMVTEGFLTRGISAALSVSHAAINSKTCTQPMMWGVLSQFSNCVKSAVLVLVMKYLLIEGCLQSRLDFSLVVKLPHRVTNYTNHDMFTQDEISQWAQWALTFMWMHG